MVHDWMKISLELSDKGVVSGILGTRTNYIYETSYQTEEPRPIIYPPKGMRFDQFFFFHLKYLESQGWEVFNIDMNHVVPWHAILRKPVESDL